MKIKTLWMIVGIVAIGILAAVCLNTRVMKAGQAAPADTATFDLKYRGIDTLGDPLDYRSYWGFGGPPEASDPFILAVKSQVKEYTPVYNGELPKAKWAVVELQDKKPVAFYFDINADGKVSDNEKFLPVPTEGASVGFAYAFVTSDFVMRTDDRRQIPFRVMLVGNAYGSDQISYMWSPACVLEGQTTLAGEPMKLFLYANNFSASFTTFGWSQFTLVPAGQKLEGYLPRSALSSLVQHNGTFYRVKVSGTHEKDKTVQVVFEKDTRPTGRMALALQGTETLKTRLQSVTIAGTTDNSINFGMRNPESPMPEGQYRLSYANISYGTENADQWRIILNEGPSFEIKADQTHNLELGGPKLSIKAIDEQDRYKSDVKERSSFAKGTAIYLTPQIKGNAGEAYMRFSQKDAGANRMNDIKPHLTIVNAEGKQVVSTDLEYG